MQINNLKTKNWSQRKNGKKVFNEVQMKKINKSKPKKRNIPMKKSKKKN